MNSGKTKVIYDLTEAARVIDASVVVVKEREYKAVLDNLKVKPDIVVCDSQVVMEMVADTPRDVKCTTFSILFARFKGELLSMVKGVGTINQLKDGDKILIAEACSHHAIDGDIGREKIPRWLKKYTGVDLNFEVSSGRDYPENLKNYALIIHCGACMLTRNEMHTRLKKAMDMGIPITNYGLCISLTHGVLERVLSPFPEVLDAYLEMK